ncbi:hypothetical protein [Sphingomonas sp. Leaf25]|uniref:hypothetical protein n=1 Tax=Sphingomonas sp. Leaf25 TaxID=1735692 RepID=UPI0007021565|nr:hypothetical protein [Sphingomonas sp. Leaf25]KQN05191.1 hypothetical protein ASE78_16845 [Sphingomonas sp. Leaf25]
MPPTRSSRGGAIGIAPELPLREGGSSAARATGQGSEAGQAMLIVGQRSDSRPVAARAAALPFLLSEAAAQAVIDAPCGEAALPPVEREILRTRAFLNPYAFGRYA